MTPCAMHLISFGGAELATSCAKLSRSTQQHGEACMSLRSVSLYREGAGAPRALHPQRPSCVVYRRHGLLAGARHHAVGNSAIWLLIARSYDSHTPRPARATHDGTHAACILILIIIIILSRDIVRQRLRIVLEHGGKRSYWYSIACTC
eukprot:COSAG02_NODE_835_length_16654_cov_52.747569_5_plen_149_part_00